MLEHRAHFINGQWQPSNGPDRIEVVNAATEEVMGSIPAGYVGSYDYRGTYRGRDIAGRAYIEYIDCR